METAPATAHVWGLFKQNVGLSQIVKPGYMLCWAAKWVGEKGMYFSSIQHHSPEIMMAGMHDLLNEADAVVHYNGARFDMPTINREFILNGFLPPSPYKQIDLLRVARQQFKFQSNKLDFVSKALGLTPKESHAGFQLWVDVMNNDPAAWIEMERYNIGDVTTLEELYFKLLPWIKSHPNRSVGSASIICPTCGSDKYQNRGTYTSTAAVYQRHNCTNCGTWFRSIKNLSTRTTAVAL